MKETSRPDKKESSTEKLSRFGRNINALGAVALAGLALAIPGPNVILSSWAGLNAVQAGGFEALRRYAKKSKQKKEPKS